MSRTSITSLPTDGLQDVVVLRLQQTYSLHTFPSIYNFKYIKKALLTYPYHCCSFRFPAKHDPSEYAKFQRIKEDIQKKHCVVDDTSTESIGAAGKFLMIFVWDLIWLFEFFKYFYLSEYNQWAINIIRSKV